MMDDATKRIERIEATLRTLIMWTSQSSASAIRLDEAQRLLDMLAAPDVLRKE